MQNIDNPIGPGLKIAILDNKISTKAPGDSYFSGKWFVNDKAAEKYWKSLTEKIGKKYNYEIKIVSYPDIGITRRELTVGVTRNEIAMQRL